MTYSDRDIIQALQRGEINITPFRYDQLQPASYDCRLYHEILVYAPDVPAVEQVPMAVSLKDGDYLLRPGEFILACTEEYFELNDRHIFHVDGKSSLGRQSLVVHQQAGWADPGFNGQITLEVTCTLPMYLRDHMPICQMVFGRTQQPAINAYGSNRASYNGQRGPTPARRK